MSFISKGYDQFKSREDEKTEIRRLAMKSTINALIVSVEDVKSVFIGTYPTKVDEAADKVVESFVHQCDDTIIDLKLLALRLGFRLGTTT